MRFDWLSSILEERFGIRFFLDQEENSLRMSLPGSGANIIFDALQPVFLQPDSSFPCAFWDPASEGWNSASDQPLHAPGSKHLKLPLIEENGSGFRVHYDILGLAYWMLSRQEEVARNDVDEHARFPSTSSHAFRHGYLDRPLVDEWLHILRQLVERTWPSMELKMPRFDMKLSHDVDEPSRYAFRSASKLVRAIGGDFLKRKDFKSGVLAPWIRARSKREIHTSDPSNTFDWIMNVSDDFKIKSAFYFICGRTRPSKDADYEPEHPAIRALMRRIHARGHEIGLHPSFDAFKKPEIVFREASRLRRICAEEGIEQAEWGGRMHYLRWETPTTLHGWEQAGFAYESTLSYADRPGFRCGTCFEYPAFDPVRNRSLQLRIRPLIAMESTVIAARYMNLGVTPEALSKFKQLKDACRRVNGSFTLLWHNSELNSKNLRHLYLDVLAA